MFHATESPQPSPMTAPSAEASPSDLERHLTALTKTIEATGHSGTLDECLQMILDALLEAMQAPVGMVGLIEDGGEFIRLHAQKGLSAEYHAATPVARVGEGLAWRAIQTRDLLLGQNFAADARPAVREAAAREGLQAYAVVPLQVRDKALGVIQVIYRSPHKFTPYEQTTLRTVGRQIGLFIENYRMAQAQKRRIAELEALNHIGRAISSTLDLNALLKTFYTEISRLLDTTNFFVALYDPVTQVFSLPIHYDSGIEYPPEPTPIGPGLTSYVIQQRKSLLIRDMERERATLPVQPVLGGTGKRAASWLGVPMIFGEEVLGAIVIQSYLPNTYTGEDQRFLEAVADQAAIGIKNALLFTETRQRADEATSLYNIGVLLASTRDMDEILMAIYHEASKVLDTAAFSVALYDEARNEIKYELFVDQGEVLDKFSTVMSETSLNAWMIRNQQAILVRDPEKDSFPVEGVLIAGHEWWPVSFLGVPLIYSGRAIGAIAVQSQKPFAFDARQKQVLEAIAHLAAPALENARLLRQLQASVEAQSQLLKTIQALGTPLIPVAEGIVVLPLIGHIDQPRAQNIMESLLNGIATHKAEVVLIDITGVPMVDTAIANSLLQAAKAANLLGTRVMLVGIRPEVAQTIVNLGIDLTGISNFANLQSGIEAALRTRGLQISRIPGRIA